MSSTATSGWNYVAPKVTTTYNITCFGAGGSASASATVTVSAPAPAPALVDNDGDGVADNVDNCGKPGTDLYSNPDQADANSNGVGDRCDFVWGSDGAGDDTSSNADLAENPGAGGNSGKGGCGGTAVGRWMTASNARRPATFKSRIGGVVFWRYKASISVCVVPQIGAQAAKILAWGAHSQLGYDTFNPFWRWNKSPNWDLGNIDMGGSSQVRAMVQDSFTGCPLSNILGLGCVTRNITLVFDIYASGWFTVQPIYS